MTHTRLLIAASILLGTLTVLLLPFNPRAAAIGAGLALVISSTAWGLTITANR